MAAGERIIIGSATVDFSSLTIDGPAGHSSIEPKIMHLLQVLVESAGIVVTRADLLERVWGETYGGDESLSRGISILRKAFGDTRGGQKYIETVPKRGYRLAADILDADEKHLDVTSSATPEAILVRDKATSANTRSWTYAIVTFLLVSTLAFTFYQSAFDPENSAWGSAKPSKTSSGQLTHKSIAVLPFEDLSSESDQQYLADGIAEEILNALVKFPDLRVIGRTSSFVYRKQSPDLKRIRATLGVAHVLSGSLRKQGDQVRVTVALAQTSTGETVWADTYNGKLADLFDLQANIARGIASSLGGVLNLSTEQKLANKLTNNEQAYVLFVQGRSMARKFGHDNKLTAKQLLEKAVVIDPVFAAAWAWLAQAELYLTLTAAPVDVPAHIEAAQRAAEYSIQLDPDLAMGHYVRSMLYEYNLDFSSSIDAMEKAFALNPAKPFFAVRRGFSYGVIGLSDKSARQIGQGLSLDPTDAIGLYNQGVALFAMGQETSAKQLIQRSIDLGFEPAGVMLCSLMTKKSERDAAASCWHNLSDEIKNRFGPVLSQPDNWSLIVEAIVSEDPALRNDAMALVDRHYEQNDTKPNLYTLLVYLFIGKPEKFMATFVDRPFAFNAGAVSNIWSDKPSNIELRRHPEFSAFANRIGLVRAWQKYGWPAKCNKRPETEDSSGDFACH